MAGLTQIALAERVGLSQPYLSKIERGDVRPCAELALRIARVVGVPVATLWPALAHLPPVEVAE